MDAIIQLARKSIQALLPYSSARNESSQKGIQLDANENPFQRADGLNRYPEPQPFLLRECFAKYYGISTSEILVTRGSDEGIDLLTRVFCEARRDAVVITPPTYGMYEVAAKIQGVALQSIPLLQAAGFALDKDKILSQWTKAQKLVFLCSPNNPTGNILKREEILGLCAALQGKALVVLDEAYIEFSTSQSLSPFIAQYPNLVILRTLSKAFGLAGARLGAIIADSALIALLTKVLAPYPISTPVVDIAVKALGQDNQALIASQIQRIRQERQSLQSFLQRLSSVEKVYPSEANFLLVKVKDAAQWMARCRDHQILIRSRVKLYGLENAVRISIGVAEENQALKEVLAHV